MRASARWIVSAVAVLAGVSGAVHADSVFTDRRTQTVNISASDLQSEAGRRVAYSQLKQAAKNVCAEVDGRRTLDNAVSYARCVDETLDEAIAQVRDPLFKEYAASRKSGQSKPMITAASR